MDDLTHWDLIRTERARLARALAGISPEMWRAPSLCSDWSVKEVVSHLSGAANTGRWA